MDRDQLHGFADIDFFFLLFGFGLFVYFTWLCVHLENSFQQHIGTLATITKERATYFFFFWVGCLKRKTQRYVYTRKKREKKKSKNTRKAND